MGRTPGRFDLPTFLRLRINRAATAGPSTDPLLDGRLLNAGDFHHTDLRLPHHYAGARPLLAFGWAGLPARPSFAVYSTIGRGESSFPPTSCAAVCVVGLRLWMLYRNHELPITAERQGFAAHIEFPSWALRFFDFSGLFTCHISLASIPQTPFLQVRHLSTARSTVRGFLFDVPLQYHPTSYPRRTRTDKEGQWFSPPKRTTDKRPSLRGTGSILSVSCCLSRSSSTNHVH